MMTDRTGREIRGNRESIVSPDFADFAASLPEASA